VTPSRDVVFVGDKAIQLHTRSPSQNQATT
jgi:hypothetical protein